MGLIAPKFIALDSSHLVDLAEDASSGDAKRRNAAAAFVETLSGDGGVLVLSWHHIQELLQHEGGSVVASCVRFLQSLPMVAWVAGARDDTFPGTIADITTREIAAAYHSPGADAATVRNQVTQEIFRLGSGKRAVAPFLAYWELLQPFFRAHQKRHREIVAISKSGFSGTSKSKVSDLLNGELRSPQDMERQLDGLYQRLATDIRERGDRRIDDPALPAAQFMEGVRLTGESAIVEKSNPGLQLLKAMDIVPSDIEPEMTMGELGDLAGFHKLLRMASEMLRLPFAALKVRVKESQVPSCVVQRALRRYAQDLPEWEGGELTDRYLVCLALYADITYVDKRTLENVTRARRKDSEVRTLLRRVEKAPGYEQVVTQLTDRKPERPSEGVRVTRYD